MQRRPHTFTLLQATQQAPTLAHLCELADESAARLQCIQSLLPATLRSAVRPGPIDAGAWCLLLENAAVASKLRQLIPALLAHLRSKGWPTESIRLKVQMSQNLTRK